MTRLELAIAWRYLRSRRGSRLLSFITVIALGGVVVGVSALILIIGVMNGLQYDLREKILVGSPDIRVLPRGSEMHMDDWRAVLASVRAQPRVVAAAPFVMTKALVGLAPVAVGGGEPAIVVGIDPQTEEHDEVIPIRRHLVSGSFDFVTRDPSRAGLVVGAQLLRNLGAATGDEIDILTAESVRFSPVTGHPHAVEPLRGQVTGSFSSGMYEYDNAYIYMNLSEAQAAAGLDGAVTGIDVRTPDRRSARRVAEALETVVDVGVYRVETWEDQNASLFSALRLEKIAMAVILLLVVLVAAFNIVSVLTMLVHDKTREIGILRAMGMTAKGVRRIFLIQGMFIGVVGTAVGLVLGLMASVTVDRFRLIPLNPAIYFIDHLPVRTEPLDVLLIVVSSMIIAILATLNPANQAARLYPLEAIRHE